MWATLVLVMALEFAHGDLAWNSADVATSTYVVSTLSFQPKALLFLINGQSSATDSITANTISARVCYGFATSTSDRRCMGFMDVFNAAAADTEEIYRDDAVLATVSATGVVDGLLDLTALASNGFTLTVDDAAPANLRVFWCAWGGSDITVATTGAIAEPGSTGSVDYTVTGFDANAGGDQVVLFAGCQLTAAPPTAAVQDSGLCFGFATGSAQQVVFAVNSDEASTTMDTDKYQRSGECVAMMTVAGGNPNTTAALTSFAANKFTLNWTASGVANRRYMFLAIKGGQWRAGTYTISNSVGSTATVSGLPFQPVGGLNAAAGDVDQSSAGTSSTYAQMGTGMWSSLSSRRSMYYFSEDGSANADIGLGVSYDQIMNCNAGALVGVLIEIDIDAINSDGFRVRVDTDNSSNATSFCGYLTFGSAPAVTDRPPPPLIGKYAVTRASFW